jgi:hypothetical protein
MKHLAFNDSEPYYRGISYMLGLDEDRNEIKEAPELNEEYHEVMNTKIYTDQDREMAIKV